MPNPTERGTALVLVPCLLLVLLALGSIAIDGALTHASHRSIHRTVSAAADDAAASFDEDRLYSEGTLLIDPEAAHRVAAARIDAASLPGELVGPVRVLVLPDRRSVEVTATVRVPQVLRVPLRQGDGDETIEVRARARMQP